MIVKYHLNLDQTKKSQKTIKKTSLIKYFFKLRWIEFMISLCCFSNRTFCYAKLKDFKWWLNPLPPSQDPQLALQAAWTFLSPSLCYILRDFIFPFFLKTFLKKSHFWCKYILKNTKSERQEFENFYLQHYFLHLCKEKMWKFYF